MYDLATRASRERFAWEQAYTAGTDSNERYLWTKRIERASHIERQFYQRLDRFAEKRILSIGGGVDHVANYLASRGNRVISADISFNAAIATRNFDRLSGTPSVHAVVADCQEQCFRNRSFDAVVSKRALHHPQAIRTEDEKELAGDDLRVLQTRFHSVSIRYFDLLARESLACWLNWLRLDNILLKPLGRLDDFAANRCLASLRRFCSYVIVECQK